MRADRPSSTARLIARSILLSSRDPALQALVAPGEADCVAASLRASRDGAWFRFALTRSWARRCLAQAERALLPGIFAHYLARKRWLERMIVARLQAGANQVVVLGAGYDALAWRLHRAWPAVFFCELDHPATQRAKTGALGPNAAPNLRFEPATLGVERPSAALARVAGFDPAQPTVFVAEGLLMYLLADDVRALLRDLARFNGASLAFTWMEPDAAGRAAFRGGHRMVNTWLRYVREPFAWSLRRSDLDSFLQPLGWRVESLADEIALRTTILTPAGVNGVPLAAGECVGLARLQP